MGFLSRVKEMFIVAAQGVEAFLYINSPADFAEQLRKLDEGFVYTREEGELMGSYVAETDPNILEQKRFELEDALNSARVNASTHDVNEFF